VCWTVTSSQIIYCAVFIAYLHIYLLYYTVRLQLKEHSCLVQQINLYVCDICVQY
jgi:hypothetical protein